MSFWEPYGQVNDEDREVARVECTRCNNIFYVEALEYNAPSWCPYCGGALDIQIVDSKERLT